MTQVPKERAWKCLSLYFDSWYQYGDLNAMNIRLYGEGTWEIYNSLNSDGTGGIFF